MPKIMKTEQRLSADGMNIITSKKCDTPPCHVSINLKSYLVDSSFDDNRFVYIRKMAVYLRKHVWLKDKDEWDLWQMRKHQPFYKKNLPLNLYGHNDKNRLTPAV